MTHVSAIQRPRTSEFEVLVARYVRGMHRSALLRPNQRFELLVARYVRGRTGQGAEVGSDAPVASAADSLGPKAYERHL